MGCTCQADVTAMPLLIIFGGLGSLEDVPDDGNKADVDLGKCRPDREGPWEGGRENPPGNHFHANEGLCGQE